LNELNERKEAIEKWEKDKEVVEQRLVNDEEKIAKVKQETIDLKKKVEKRQAILSTLQGENDVEEEVKKLEGEIS
jgi:outer membrane translocation and assembly module TamA